MKKRILSLLLVLSLLMGLAVLLPLGAVAEEPAAASDGKTILYESDFSAYEAGTYTADELNALLGWGGVDGSVTPGSVFEITEDGKLRMFNPFENPDKPGTMNAQYSMRIGRFPELVGSRIVFEFEKTYNESETCQQFYSTLRVAKDGGNAVEPTSNLEGFTWNRLRYENAWKNIVEQTRPENTAYTSYRTDFKEDNEDFKYGYYFVDNKVGVKQTTGNYFRTTFNSTDTFKVVIDPVNGVDYYINGKCVSSSKSEEAWRNTLYDACVGEEILIRMMPGIDVTYDNIKIYTEEIAGPEVLITELSPGGYRGDTDSYWAEYIEVYNNSDRELNIFDYCIVRDSQLDAANTAMSASNVCKILPDTTTFTSPQNPANTATLTNPSYEEGWFAPGEVVLLYNATNNLYDETATKVGVNKNLEDFRAALNLPESQKAFYCYNDYNFSLGNGGGPYLYALGYADFDYTATAQNFDNMYGNFISYVWQVGGSGQTSYNGYTFTQNYDPTNAPYTSIEYAYAENTYARLGMAIEKGSEAQTPGVLYDSQKHSFDVKVNGVSSAAAYLGEEYLLTDALSGGDLLLFGEALVDGETAVLTGDAAKVTAMSDIDVTKIELITLEGAGIRTAEPTGMRWQTAVNKADFDYISAMVGDSIQSVAIGTLITPTQRVQELESFTKEALDAGNFSDGGYLDVVATAGEWFGQTDTAYIFAGSVADILAENYALDFSAVGYLTVTLADGTAVTVYGWYDEALHARNVQEVAQAALDDPESGLTDAQKEVIAGFLPQN